MKVIFAMNNPALRDGTNLRNWYASLGVSCNCNDNVGFIEYVVKLVKNHPALWGYYIGDEVNPANHTALKAFSDLVHRTDPVHPRLFVSCSQCAHTYPPYVASLIPMTDSADVVATDYYPVGSDGWPITDTGTVAAALQSVANRNSRQSAMVLKTVDILVFSGLFVLLFQAMIKCDKCMILYCRTLTLALFSGTVTLTF